MIEDLSTRELALLKLIDIQAKEITQLEMEIESLRYNKRFTNTKFVKKALTEPKFPTFKPFTYIKEEETKSKETKKKC